jgi:hypothetical protein
VLVGLLGAEDRARKPAIPEAVKVPPGHRLLLRAEAKGVQIYRAVAGKGGKLEWALEAPLADLFDAGGKKIGYHYVGPAWEAADGSKVVRDAGTAVRSAPAPVAAKDIPWLLIKVKPEDDRKGAFTAAVYVQRIETRGGKPPAAPPVRAGTKLGVSYRAVYLFHDRGR